jgi:hypothetical protein
MGATYVMISMYTLVLKDAAGAVEYVCVRMSIYVYMYIYICIYHIYVYDLCVYEPFLMSTTAVITHVCMYVCRCICVYIYIYIYTYIILYM